MQKLNAHITPLMYGILYISFFLPHTIQSILIIVWCSWIGLCAFQQKIFLSRYECLTALLIGGGYLFYVAYLPLTPSDMRDFLYHLLERKVSLFILPFVIPLSLKLYDRSPLKDLKWFVLANVLHGVIINSVVFFQLITHNSFAGINHVVYRQAFDSLSGIHPTYYGMYCCFSSVLLLYLPAIKAFPSFTRLSLHACILLFLILLSPKISLLISVIIYSYYFLRVLQWPVMRKTALISIVILLLSVLYFSIPFFQQRVMEVFNFFQHEKIAGLENSMVSRQFIFEIDMRLLQEHWLFGLGPVELEYKLRSLYFFTSTVIGFPVGTYNTHNEFLNQWLCFGLTGFLYFLAVLLLQFIKALKKQDPLHVFFLLIITLTCVTENILSRQTGIVFVALFSAIFYFSKNKSGFPESQQTKPESQVDL